MSNSIFNTEDIHTPEDGYRALANEIIIMAAKDYRNACKKLKKDPDNKKAKSDMDELVDFFYSPYCDSLTELDPIKILDRLDDEIWG